MDRMEDIFRYDETSRTCLRWNVERLSGNTLKIKSAIAGEEAGSLDYRGEAFTTRFNGKAVKVHNIIAHLHGLSISKKDVIDHIDGNPTNNKISNLRVVDQGVNARNKKKQYNNTSGHVGVSIWVDQRGSKFWLARWQNGVGKRGSKCFSMNKFGEIESYRLACEYRKAMIEVLNKLGHGYTERHGE